MTQKQFAKVIGWSPSTVALYEVGEIPTKSNNRLLKVMIKGSNVMKEFIAESKADSDLEEL
ncbi:helix-turn-helix domain-containing protein [Lactobacillus helveticus]|uniref:helix-turn-helix domain-containing protein n=1 Tax=Lactobacillus helveticus TaxID=1587 RepID=UPI00197C5202|nr:helix-turn-helix domain-containing protein [Lactobacillus helveticus]MBN6049326.1 helix-turn-helix domain-containing protein [Lactobacillus helveticus]